MDGCDLDAGWLPFVGQPRMAADLDAGWLPFAIWGAKIGDFWIFSKKNKEILLFAVLF